MTKYIVSIKNKLRNQNKDFAVIFALRSLHFHFIETENVFKNSLQANCKLYYIYIIYIYITILFSIWHFVPNNNIIQEIWVVFSNFLLNVR